MNTKNKSQKYNFICHGTIADKHYSFCYSDLESPQGTEGSADFVFTAGHFNNFGFFKPQMGLVAFGVINEYVKENLIKVMSLQEDQPGFVPTIYNIDSNRLDNFDFITKQLEENYRDTTNPVEMLAEYIGKKKQ